MNVVLRKPFNNEKDARDFIEGAAMAVKADYEFRSSLMPSVHISEEWSPFIGETKFTLSILDPFDNSLRNISWEVKEFTNPASIQSCKDTLCELEWNPNL